ncbi:MAG TPA: ATP-binding protein [Blastocatellia bacterium]|nr:ATP-binding protein [Blastocatellia bacterium]
MFRRNIEESVQEAISHSRVVLINGPRQAGKTTLVRELINFEQETTYITFDDITSLSFAQRDPSGFISQFGGTTIIDEIQRAPELFLPIKATVDRSKRPGSFVLTGSANIFALPRLADSLAGRMQIITLWPLSQGEIDGVKENFIDWVFSEKIHVPRAFSGDRKEFLTRAIRGGYPEVLDRKADRLRRLWLDGYVTTLINRDVREVGNVRDLKDFPVLLNALAIRSGTLLNLSDISRTAGIPHETLRRYMALLETLWLVVELPAWSSNLGRRLLRTPKITLNDTGLLAGILNLDQRRLNREPVYLGQLLESFAVMELRKQMGWNETPVGLFHFRDQKGAEVDIVIESASGEIVGIEVKSTATPRAEDFAGLRFLQSAVGDRFRRGVLLHTGDKAINPSKDLYALPFSALWRRYQST